MIRTAIAFAFLATSFVMPWPIVAEMSAASRCRDAGGSYDYSVGHCDFRAKHPSMGLWQQHGITLLGSVALGLAGCLLLFRRQS
jgi:hypothetical protein